MALAACSTLDVADETPAVPAADRESWGARLEVRGRRSKVIISAPYVQDFLEGQVARADSGVAIDFRDMQGHSTTRLRAGRLTLSYESQQVDVADCVRVESADGTVVWADSLVWEPDRDALLVPGTVRIEQPRGVSVGRDLSTSPGMTRWTVKRPHSRWRVGDLGQPDDDAEPVPLEAAARGAEVTLADGHVEAVYDSFAATYSGRALTSAAARYTDRQGGQVVLSGGAAAADSGWTLGADSLAYELAARRLRARGQVRLSDGALSLSAEQLVEEGDGDLWVATGAPATVADGDVSVAAPSVVYERLGQSLVAAVARLRQGDRLLRADSLRYARTDGLCRAAGAVVLRVPAFAGEATARWATFSSRDEWAVLGGAPALSRTGEAGELVMGADTMWLDLGQRSLRGAPGYAVSAASVSVQAQRGAYRRGDDRAELGGRVVLLQAAGEGARLEADSMLVHLAGEAIARIEVPGSVEGTVGSAATQVTWLSAAAATIALDGGRLASVELTGAAEATHRESGHGRVSRFRARDMSLHFGAGEELEAVRARGGAQVQAVLPGVPEGAAGQGADPEGEPAYNRVAGEALDITLVGGEVVEVGLLESVEGRFLPAEDEATSTDGAPGDR